MKHNDLPISQQAPPQAQKSQMAVLIPVAGDGPLLADLLPQLIGHVPVYIIDGLDEPDTASVARSHNCHYLVSDLGRGEQIAAGVRHTREDWLWILHADAIVQTQDVLRMKEICSEASPAWGRCDVSIPGLDLIAWSMNLRSRATGICTGDQGMYFHRALLTQIGGFPRQPLMEDIEVCKRLRRQCRQNYRPLSLKIGTSNRRWKNAGVLRTIVRMWWYRWRYFAGGSPVELYNAYYPERSSNRS